jgi:ppGpp synthetase/RelA/SpoT-type nucleotidyltranferase
MHLAKCFLFRTQLKTGYAVVLGVPTVIDKLAKLDTAFREKRKLYTGFTNNIETLVDTLLDAAGIEVFRSEGRTKTRKSFEEKIRREGKDDKYTKLGDITDLSGVRIVGFGLDDVDRICEVIKANFEIDQANSMDKRLTIPADQFGYLSIHYVVSHTPERLKLAENVPYAGMKAEIQVRTVLQHAWAVLDHKFRYDRPEDLPREVQRKLFRIGAQLEASDEDLTAVQRQITALRANYAEDFAKGRFGTSLNRDSLEVYIQDSETMREIVASAKKVGIKVGTDGYRPPGSITALLSTLDALKIVTVEDANSTLSTLSKTAERKFSAYHKVDDHDALLSRPTLVRVLLSMAEGEAGSTALHHSRLAPRLKQLIAKAKRRHPGHARLRTRASG